MEGACVTSEPNEGNVLYMYKEFSDSPGNVLLVTYHTKTGLLEYRVTTKKIAEIIGLQCKEIVVSLPYDKDQNKMIKKWVTTVMNKLKNYQEKENALRGIRNIQMSGSTFEERIKLLNEKLIRNKELELLKKKIKVPRSPLGTLR